MTSEILAFRVSERRRATLFPSRLLATQEKRFHQLEDPGHSRRPEKMSLALTWPRPSLYLSDSRATLSAAFMTSSIEDFFSYSGM